MTCTSKVLKCLFTSLFFLFLIDPASVSAQISEGGLPPSFNYPQTRSATEETKVPIDFYIEDLRETDNWKARTGIPMPISTLISVDYTMDNAGYYSTLPGSERIWRLHLKAEDAVAIMLYYNDFYIPEGGKLFIYSADKSQLLGAYTHRTNPGGGLFASEFIGGDELILEYVASETSEEKPRICIHEIGYGYNTSALREFCGITTRASSGSCMVNINCEEGNGWQNEKKSVCYTIQKIGNKNYICSASLMNNTAEDFKPLILTAYHCAFDGSTVASSSDMEQWLFYFHRELEECSNSSLPAVSKTMTGCRMLANTGMGGGSDGLLLLLNDMIPEEYDVFYNGWDHSGNVASSGVCIHHPQGDYKKISTYNESTKNYTFQSSEFTGDSHAHWNVVFAQTGEGRHGVTDDGSSGSPLYNENKLVIGTLTGGNSSCVYLRGLNVYGKMSYHWDRYKTDSSTRMDVWLDPLNKGVETWAGRFRKVLKPAPTHLKIMNLGQSVSLSWSAPSGNEAPERYYVYRNNTRIGQTTSLSLIDYEPVVGSLVYAVSAVYAGEEESAFATATLSFIQHKAPSDLVVKQESNSSQSIEFTWKAPVYEQTIYWGTLEASYMVGWENKAPFYFGQRWSSAEISPLNEKTIKAVQFMPLKSNEYEVYISQGDRYYSQSIQPSTLRYEEINTVTLTTPFVIDGSKSLIVSIYTSLVGSDHQAVCDNGPAVNNKGNVYSVDGIEWNVFHDVDSDPDNYNYNFVVTAIVSSENGTIPINSRNDVEFRSGIVSDKTIRPRAAAISLTDEALSLHSSQPAAFPEITKYRIYRTGSVFKDVSASATSYTSTHLSNHYYEITAFYDEIESEKSNRANVTIVDNEQMDNVATDIFPTRFSENVTLRGYESVKRVDVVSVSGKICLVVDNPDKTMDTSSLSPGMYFFRIYGADGKVKVVRAIKAN